MIRFRAHLLYQRHRASLSTRIGATLDEGAVRYTGWEWGFIKGKRKRALNRIAALRGMEGRIRAFNFLIGARYAGELTGTNADARAVWAEL